MESTLAFWRLLGWGVFGTGGPIPDRPLRLVKGEVSL